MNEKQEEGFSIFTVMAILGVVGVIGYIFVAMGMGA